MRESRGSLAATALAKARREGPLALALAAPRWLATTAAREGGLELRRRWRRWRYRRRGWRAVPDPAATIEVDPASVAHLVPLSRFDTDRPRDLLGTVRGGDWDLDPVPITDRPKYRACRARVEGVPWTETGIVDHLADELAESDAGTIEHGCGSRADLRERYETERETLYRSLRESGYDRERSPVCCRVHVGRDGALLFASGGRHRFYLSRLLGIERVPVQVCCRHRQWQAVRETVARAADTGDLPPSVRPYLGHPDLRAFDLSGPAPDQALTEADVVGASARSAAAAATGGGPASGGPADGDGAGTPEETAATGSPDGEGAPL